MALAVGLSESAVQCAAQKDLFIHLLWRHSSAPNNIPFLFYSIVFHYAGWLNRILSPAIIINQNYGLKKMEMEKIAYQDVKHEQEPKNNSVMRKREVKAGRVRERFCICAV